MNWDDVLDRMSSAGLKPVEETYMENYGKILAAQRAEFQGRIIRCTYGKILCAGVDMEVFLFPSVVHLQEFMELMGNDPWWVIHENAVVHFPVCDPEIVETVVNAFSNKF